MAEQEAASQVNGHVTATNGKVEDETPEPKRESSTLSSKPSLKREARDDDVLQDTPASPSPKKKRKAAPVDDDAAFAARLQAEENGRARATRGGVNKKQTSAKKKKKAPKKKTSDKVKGEDDSDLEGSGSEAAEKKVNRNGGFHVSRAPEDIFPLTNPRNQ